MLCVVLLLASMLCELRANAFPDEITIALCSRVFPKNAFGQAVYSNLGDTLCTARCLAPTSPFILTPRCRDMDMFHPEEHVGDIQQHNISVSLQEYIDRLQDTHAASTRARLFCSLIGIACPNSFTRSTSTFCRGKRCAHEEHAHSSCPNAEQVKPNGALTWGCFQPTQLAHLELSTPLAYPCRQSLMASATK